jgi:phosphatidate cytidylyltransferase
VSRIGSDLPKRAGVAVVLIAVAAAALWIGGFAFWLLLTVAGLLMLDEWGTLSRADKRQTRLAQYALSVPLAILCPLAAGPGFFAFGLVFAAFFFTVIITRNVQLAWGNLYVGLPVLALLLLRAHPDGFAVTLWTMALVWACDSGAYFAGRMIGGRKLAPAISPNKTWAGSIGGVAAAVMFTMIVVTLRPEIGAGAGLVAFSAVLAVCSQAGDLFESHLKRVAGVKDSGNLLPGHGGLLDRLDGLVPVAPLVALWFVVAFWIENGRFWW